MMVIRLNCWVGWRIVFGPSRDSARCGLTSSIKTSLMTSESNGAKPLSANENIKTLSNLLRGSIAEDLRDPSTGAISEENSQLTKFHGLYLQDDRAGVGQASG